MCCLILKATYTHATRRCHWAADSTSEIAGDLTVCQGPEVDTYRVVEDTSEPFGARAFRVDDYRVVLTPIADPVDPFLARLSCTCKAGKTYRMPTCKHRDGCYALWCNGDFDRVHAEELPAVEVPTDDELRMMAEACGQEW